MSDLSMLKVRPSLPRITMVTCLLPGLALPLTEGASVTTYTAAATPSATFLLRAYTKGLFKGPSAATQWRMLLGQVKHTTLKQLRIFHPESLCTDAHRFLFTSLFNFKLCPQRLYFLLPPVQSTALSASVSDVVQHPVSALHNRAQGLPPLSVLQRKINLSTLEEKFQCVCVFSDCILTAFLKWSYTQ